ncbi:hypothetical protein MAR_034604 [Mya arenaria]|uniref:EGF-like domain-containing protein n=1 Tax=Mya arenaria TaxID=6604 RepID=A0ABY7EHQ2_MYAAR|nr:hypothetical protein MAR_034604 [Mya arenaria]
MGERCNVQKTFVRCYNPCKTTANGGCINGGVCYFDGQEYSIKCRCPSDEGRFVYSGEHCEKNFRQRTSLQSLVEQEEQ